MPAIYPFRSFLHHKLFSSYSETTWSRVFFSANTIFWAFFHENTQFCFILSSGYRLFPYRACHNSLEAGIVTFPYRWGDKLPQVRNLSKATQLGSGRARVGIGPPESALSHAPVPQCTYFACFHQLDYKPLEDGGLESLSLQCLELSWHIIEVNRCLLYRYLLTATFSVLHLSSLLCRSHFHDAYSGSTNTSAVIQLQHPAQNCSHSRPGSRLLSSSEFTGNSSLEPTCAQELP